jgi:hypothetical protein
MYTLFFSNRIYGKVESPFSTSVPLRHLKIERLEITVGEIYSSIQRKWPQLGTGLQVEEIIRQRLQALKMHLIWEVAVL